jgi:hypothetical protein
MHFRSKTRLPPSPLPTPFHTLLYYTIHLPLSRVEPLGLYLPQSSSYLFSSFLPYDILLYL